MWKTILSKVVHKNPWFYIINDKVIRQDGSKGNYFTVHTRGSGKSVFIVAIDIDKIIFVKQFRYSSNKWHLELPGGASDHGSLLKSAKTELEEEIGYQAKRWTKLGSFDPWPGPSAEDCYVFLAQNIVYVGEKREKSEQGIRTIKINLNKVYEMLDNGKFTDGQTISALSFTRKYLMK